MPEENNKTKKTKMIIGFGILFIVGAILGGGWWWYQSTKYISTDDARIDGTIVSVSAKIPGRVMEVLVKEGDQVKAGQIIARIDAREAVAQRGQNEAALAVAKAKYDEVVAGSRPQEIGQSQAGLGQSKAMIAQNQATVDNAAKNYERMSQLYQEGAVSSAQRDDAKAAYFVAKEARNASLEGANVADEKLNLVVAGSREESIRAAAAQVKQAEAALEGTVILTEYTTIVAPVDGVVALKSVNPGEVIAAGQPLFSVVNCTDVWLNARIEETKIGKIKMGQTVEYTIDGYPGRHFTGTIFSVGSATNSIFALVPTENASGNFTKVTQRVSIKITLPENVNDIIFRPGMQALVDIHIQ